MDKYLVVIVINICCLYGRDNMVFILDECSVLMLDEYMIVMVNIWWLCWGNNDGYVGEIFGGYSEGIFVSYVGDMFGAYYG